MKLHIVDVLAEAFSDAQQLHVGGYASSGRFQHVSALTEDANDQFRPLFCEMLELCSAVSVWDSVYFWRESSRWIKYEETVEEGGNRWSKPHVTLISIPSLVQFRQCIRSGTTILDMQAESFDKVVGTS